MNVRDFRPISLIRSVYKILAKVLANSLMNVMGEMISWENFANSSKYLGLPLRAQFKAIPI